MSKIKINDKVIVKQSGKIGVVKGREVCNLPDGKVKIEYIVKTGEGFENWLSVPKKELEKVVPVKTRKIMNTIIQIKIIAAVFPKNPLKIKLTVSPITPPPDEFKTPFSQAIFKDLTKLTLIESSKEYVCISPHKNINKTKN